MALERALGSADTLRSAGYGTASVSSRQARRSGQPRAREISSIGPILSAGLAQCSVVGFGRTSAKRMPAYAGPIKLAY